MNRLMAMNEPTTAINYLTHVVFCGTKLIVGTMWHESYCCFLSDEYYCWYSVARNWLGWGDSLNLK